MKHADLVTLSTTAARLRLDITEMIGVDNKGHFGGSLSATDILTTLYFSVMNIDPARPDWPERDRFILSKGHSSPAQYAALARRGFFPAEQLKMLKELGSALQGHPDKTKVPGVEANTGSLGQGLSQGIGMALALRQDAPDARVYVMLGDGELDEGQLWEAVMFAGANGVDNLTAIVDRNRLQAMGETCSRLNIGEPGTKFAAFGWNVLQVDGHDFDQLLQAFDLAKATQGQPTVIVAATTKGKGIACAENNVGFHNGQLTQDQYDQAVTCFRSQLGGDC